ncbi:DUF2264 domain-containing protein [Mucilaginibacter arboris]|uniref:DUF2264 domain-containing protein n=1 Tax=Mucilaginibacter arboris TaxID=2682090 RepID=A0A7K1SSI1_9SPHI|nr:DUF2264 domain-containing protein [Mucilaginibacter arboris]MVN20255.1 DUF2264 domain-containing protein [Mucilaginibacter arboris]
MMMKKLLLILIATLLFLTGLAQKKAAKSETTRQVWLNYMDKIARPVLSNIAEDKLKANMPVRLSEHIDNKESRSKVAYLEAFARTLSGIAPWLQLEGGNPVEVKLRNQYREWAIKGIANAVNPDAKDYLQWNGGQPLVDASYVALALIRSPWLWEHLDEKVKQQVVTVLKITRNTVPVYTNWILFTGVIEAFFYKYDLGYDAVRMEYGIREFTEHWYVGDGMYSDGMQFHLDYYNSIVIQPNLSTMLDVLSEKHTAYPRETENVKLIGQRYAQILERMINTDGSYPATGRSIVYRGGVFHHLANVAYKKQLPSSLSPAQVREALTAVIKKTLGAPGTFDQNGWLNIGLYGIQPGLADFYITTGSLYICSNIFLPLGLPETDEFWNTPPQPWTAVKIWSGQDVPADHALELRR